MGGVRVKGLTAAQGLDGASRVTRFDAFLPARQI